MQCAERFKFTAIYPAPAPTKPVVWAACASLVAVRTIVCIVKAPENVNCYTGRPFGDFVVVGSVECLGQEDDATSHGLSAQLKLSTPNGELSRSSRRFHRA